MIKVRPRPMMVEAERQNRAIGTQANLRESRKKYSKRAEIHTPSHTHTVTVHESSPKDSRVDIQSEEQSYFHKTLCYCTDPMYRTALIQSRRYLLTMSRNDSLTTQWPNTLPSRKNMMTDVTLYVFILWGPLDILGLRGVVVTCTYIISTPTTKHLHILPTR